VPLQHLSVVLHFVCELRGPSRSTRPMAPIWRESNSLTPPEIHRRTAAIAMP
jgi:hypothetical protein